MTKVNHALKLLSIIASVFFIGYFLEPYSYFSPPVSNYFEISTELLPLVLSFSIFVMTWHAYTKNRDNNSLFLGAAFLIVGVFDLYHMISKPFMPDFITHNSLQKAAVFWIGARLLSALLFLASAFIYKDSVPRLINKPVLFVSANVLSIIFLLAVLQNPEDLHAMQYPDGSFSAAWAFLVFSSSVVISYAGYMYSRRHRETGQKNIVCLIYGFVIIISSNLLYLSSDYSGHLLRAAGYYFVYLSLFKSSIEQPYEKRVVTEEKLRHETEEKYRSLFENASDAIITIDLEDRVTSWNISAESMFGWTAQGAIGKKLSELIVPPNLLTERELIVNEAKSGRAVAGIDTIRLRKDGTRIDVSLTVSPIRDTNQNIIGISAIIRDITERKRAEQELRESEKHYRNTLDSMLEGCQIIGFDWRYLYVNDAAAAQGRKAKEELLGRTMMEMYHGIENTKMFNALQNCMDKRASLKMENEFTFTDGSKGWFELGIQPVPEGIFILSLDITERKKSDEQIKQSLREKEILLREIHHRVKNNMQVISSLLKLQSGYITEEKYLEMFKDSQNRIMSMSLVYEKLYQSKGLAKINFTEYMKELVNALFQSYGVRQGTVALSINAEDVSFVVDTAIPCGLIINELVTNSLKHAFPDGKGEIRIALHRTDENMIELIVGDNGVGIPEDVDFRKTESLGLHLVTILVENQLQGGINLDRSKGTEFQIKFKGGKNNG